jgi:hypothetical protein
MRCHICSNKLDCSRGRLPDGRLDYSKNFELNCRNYNCALRKVVERCRLTYTPATSKYFYSYCLFWITEEKYWYRILIDYDKSIHVERTAVEIIPGKNPIGHGTKSIFEMGEGFHISVDDNLPEKVPKLLKRIKNLIIFS